MKFPVRNLLPLAGGVTAFVVLLLAAQVLFVSTAAAQDVNELQRVIETQQKQLEMQQEQLQLQQKQLDEQMQLMQELQSQVKTIAEDSKATVQAPVLADGTRASGSVPADKVVTSGEERVKLSISGWVNRAVNVVDDGKDTEAYYVDNDNSESRVNFVGTAKIDDDLTLGSRIELTIAPNKASDVDQNNPEAGDVFEQRWTEVSLDSKRFGKLSLGRGFTASYGIASSDLSGTMVIATSTIVDLAGGMLFRQKSDDSLTGQRIDHSFSDFNGLSRKNRLRYDSPKFYGAHLAVSAISDKRSDAGLYWGGQGYGFKAAASAGVADLNEHDTGLQYAGSASVLHENTGLNLSLSTGLQERDNQSDATNVFVKAGWLAKLFSVGNTAFSVDYTRSENFPTENDDGYSVGVAAVQGFEKYGTDLYALYRLYSLDRDLEPEVHDMGVVSMGARVKF
jgi:predicted porin